MIITCGKGVRFMWLLHKARKEDEGTGLDRNYKKVREDYLKHIRECKVCRVVRYDDE